ncbi:PsbP-related protein [Methanobacterium ferruginis]|uniref:PsbP-related protein n=1 Tax=Methanobacterium ferruginis TaxID=710191 RepID=UPI0025736AFB|nr:PsbP-related protein [Methanobacterium ferruginis]BDZ67439.1 hypothetical protein GCM10025860_08870 [Methanobacterium ferruginis]
MKRLIYVLAILSLVIMVSGCTTSTDEWSTNNTYTGNGVTFDYPGTWNISSDSGMDDISGATSGAAVEGSDAWFGFATIDVSSLSTEQRDSLKTTLTQTYNNMNLTTEKAITVDGVSATLLSSPEQSSSGIYSNVAFWVKDDKVYIAAYTSTNEGTETFERILGSFKTT